MKSFREQLAVVMKERDKMVSQRDINECSTPAAQTLITYIRQWEFGSRNIALTQLLECDRWSKDGTLVMEKDFKGKAYPFRMSLMQGYEAYRYGDQREQFWPSYSFVRGIKNIPNNLTEDWAKELQGLFFDMGRLSIKAIKLICLGKCVKSYGVGNPYCYATWQREVGEWEEAQKAVDEFVTAKGRGWTHLTSKHLQDPNSHKGFAEEITKILANADAIVEPSIKAIQEADKKMYIRQDATRARNDVKTIKGFFQKYGQPTCEALNVVGEAINLTESEALK